MNGEYLNLGCGSQCPAGWINADISPSRPGVLTVDISRPLPFDDSIFAAVYCSHALEHLPREAAPGFMLECARVLRPGGVLRVAVPDMETIARLYLDRLGLALSGEALHADEYDWSVLELLDQMTRDKPGGHMLEYWMRDPMPAREFVFSRVGGELERFLENRPSQPPAAPSGDAEYGRFKRGGELHKWMYDRFSLGRLFKQSGFVDVRQVAPDESSIPDFSSFHLDVLENGRVRKPDSLFMEGRTPQEEAS